jgi:hypothetical protein
VVRAVPERGRNPVDETNPVLYVLGASHPARGVARSLESCPGGFGRRGMFGPLWSERVRGSEAWKEKALEGRKPRRGSAAGSGQLESARTDSQEDQGFEAGEAGGTERFRSSDPG